MSPPVANTRTSENAAQDRGPATLRPTEPLDGPDGREPCPTSPRYHIVQSVTYPGDLTRESVCVFGESQSRSARQR